MKISKHKGIGSSSDLGIKELSNDSAACLSARYYKGLSEDGCNAVLNVGGANGY